MAPVSVILGLGILISYLRFKFESRILPQSLISYLWFKFEPAVGIILYLVFYNAKYVIINIKIDIFCFCFLFIVC